MVICSSADGEEVHMRIQKTKQTNDRGHDAEEAARPVTKLAGSVIVLGLAITGLAACSDVTTDDPLPLSENDSGEIVVDPPADDGVIEDGVIEDGVEEDSGG